MVESDTPMQNAEQQQAQPSRRPRVREVSSRFMSGITATSPRITATPSSSPFTNHHSLKSPKTQRPSSVQRQRHRKLDMSLSDENTRPNPDISKSFETPLALAKPVKPHLRRPDTPVLGPSRRDTPGLHRSAAEKLLLSSGLMTPNARNQHGPEEEKHLRSSMPTFLPPVHPSAKGGAVIDARKAKFSEDVHALRLLHNRYLQFRFVNAKAEGLLQLQSNQAQRKLYSLAMKISELYEDVVRKRIELQHLVKAKALFAVLETQIPYLEEWSAFEQDISVSVSEAIQALLNACLHLPISGNVKVNGEEVKEAMNSAVKVMEMIAQHVQNFIPKAEKIDILMSELAKVASGEMSLVEECGNRLSKTYISQVEECSLRCQLIQLNTSDNMRTSTP